jgi:hypothetical protein
MNKFGAGNKTETNKSLKSKCRKVKGLLPKGVVKEVGRFGKRPFVVKAQHDFFMP